MEKGVQAHVQSGTDFDIMSIYLCPCTSPPSLPQRHLQLRQHSHGEARKQGARGGHIPASVVLPVKVHGSSQ